MMINSGQRWQIKSQKISRGTFIVGCVLTVALFILVGVIGWNMICNMVVAVAIINLGFSLYYGCKAERLYGAKEGR